MARRIQSEPDDMSEIQSTASATRRGYAEGWAACYRSLRPLLIALDNFITPMLLLDTLHIDPQQVAELRAHLKTILKAKP